MGYISMEAVVARWPPAASLSEGASAHAQNLGLGWGERRANV